MTQETVEIESLSYGRAAVARSGGRVLFIEGAAPGDRLRVSIGRDHGNWAEAAVVEIIEPGPTRVAPPCPLVESCGGCPWQHVSYPAQLAAKRRALKDTLARIAAVADAPVEEVVPSPATTGYRNRLKLRFDGGRIGFYSARSHRLVPVENCLIAEPPISAALAAVEAFARALATRPTRVELAGGGEIEGLVAAVNCQGRLRTGDSRRAEAFVSDADNPVRGLLMWGKGWSRHWGDTRRRFSVGPAATRVEYRGRAFAQVNTGANRRLVDAVLEYAAQSEPGHVLDLYAGAGNLALPLAQVAAKVEAVESNPAAISAARGSAQKLKLDNLSFHRCRVETFLAEPNAADHTPADLVVVDPPRSGLGGAARQLARLRCPRLIYVSCDAATLARDMKTLAAEGYVLKHVLPIDMFPHSYHVEAVCVAELT